MKEVYYRARDIPEGDYGYNARALPDSGTMFEADYGFEGWGG